MENPDPISTLGDQATEVNNETPASKEGETILLKQDPTEVVDKINDVEGSDEVNDADPLKKCDDDDDDDDDDVTCSKVKPQEEDNSLEANVEKEIARHLETDNSLQSNVEKEIARHLETDNSLQSNVEKEIARHFETDNSLQSNVEKEIARHFETDNSLQSNVEKEIARHLETDNSAVEMTEAVKEPEEKSLDASVIEQSPSELNIENPVATKSNDANKSVIVVLEQQIEELLDKNSNLQKQLDDALATLSDTPQKSDASNPVISELEDKLSKVDEENSKLQRRLDDALSEIYVAGCVKESLVELERQHAARIDEVATLQHLLQETSGEANSTRTRYEHECARLQAIADQLDHENKDLRIQLKMMEKSSGGFSSEGGGGGGGLLVDRDSLLAISDVTKSFARKVKSNFQQSVMPQSSPSHQPTSPVAPGLNAVEDSMKRAYEDTELLKSIVVPLEEQIQALKDKLRQTDSLLREHESRQADMLLKTEALGKWLNGQTTDEALLELENKCEGISNQDCYVGLLTIRLALVTTELEARRREQASVIQELDKCRKKLPDLRKQASAANSQLLRCQQSHLSELSRINAILTQEQKAELGSLDPDTEPDPVLHSGDVIVQHEAWSEMQNELSDLKTRLGNFPAGGQVASDEVEKMRAELESLNKEKEILSESEARLKADIVKQSVARKEIEQTWNEKAELHRFETQTLTERIIELEGIVYSLSGKYNDFCKEIRQELVKLIQYREKIVTELKRLQGENEKLVGFYEAKSDEMQNELIDLPSKVEDLHVLLLTYREELIHAKVAKEHYEERLKGEVTFLKTQLQSEQQSKESMEDQLTTEIEGLKEKIYLLESCKTELEAEQRRHREFVENEMRQRQTQVNLEKQVDAVEAEKRILDARIQEFKARVTNLQQELDNSVAVQNDFVRLSQSLQMELEKIRSQATEVRWQHEDDVDDCNNCRHSFPGTRRKKGHCRHCGKIFCHECLSKTVASGPLRRPARVCDVCHTLLVQHSAPYFSTEAPHIND